jgi:hypothetical protein
MEPLGTNSISDGDCADDEKLKAIIAAINKKRLIIVIKSFSKHIWLMLLMFPMKSKRCEGD